MRKVELIVRETDVYGNENRGHTERTKVPMALWKKWLAGTPNDHRTGKRDYINNTLYYNLETGEMVETLNDIYDIYDIDWDANICLVPRDETMYGTRHDIVCRLKEMVIPVRIIEARLPRGKWTRIAPVEMPVAETR